MMQRFLAALLLLSLAVAGRAAAVSVPLEYQAKLRPEAPASLDAGPAFLADQAAQSWFLEKRPDLAPQVFQQAMEASDRAEALLGFDDARALSAAFNGREDDPVLDRPAALLALVDRTPALAARRELYERAALEWGTLPERARELLASENVDQAAWARVSLHRRRRMIESAYEAWLSSPPSASEPADSEARYERRLAALDWYYTPQQLKISPFGQRLTRARRLAKTLERAKRLASGLDDAAASGWPEPEAPHEALDLDRRQLARLESLLAGAMLAELDGTEAGPEIRRLYAGRRPVLHLSALPAGAAAFNPRRGDITIDSDIFLDVTSALGCSPARLLEDQAALRKVAIFLAPIFAHEATHERQHARPEHNAGFAPYAEESEVESFGVQTVAARRFMLDPDYAETRRLMLLRKPLLELPRGGRAEDVRAWLRGTSFYAGLPTAPRRAALAIEQERLTSVLDIVDRLNASAVAELALRRRGRAGALKTMTVEELRRQRDNGAKPLDAVARALAYLKRWEADWAALSAKLAASLN